MSKILLIGASQRALIPSVTASGNEPVCFDMFTDWDSKALMNVGGSVNDDRFQRLSDFDSLLQIDLSRFGDLAIVGGGCELRPKVVSHIESKVPIAGTSASHLAPFQNMLTILLKVQEAGFSIPNSDCDPKKIAGPVLSKPLVGCGGQSIHEIDDAQSSCDTFERLGLSENEASIKEVYYQEKKTGLSFSALVATTSRGHSTLLGVTRQLVGSNWLGASPFTYCGSIGPMPVTSLVDFGLSHASMESIRDAATWIAEHFELKGIWGFDFLIDPDSTQYWIVDINPRIPASAELYESMIVAANPSSIRSLIDLHLQCCRNEATATEFLLALTHNDAQRFPTIEGKAILFWHSASRHDSEPASLEINQNVFEALKRNYSPQFFISNAFGFSIADIPHAQTTIQRGHPVLTLRLRDELNAPPQPTPASVDEMERRLQKKAAEIHRLLS